MVGEPVVGVLDLLARRCRAMSNFLFENVLLGVGVQAASAVYEWEGASLVPAAGGLAALSFEFFFSYFNVFTALVVLSPAADVIADAYVSQAVGEEGCGSGDAENSKIVRARREGASREISDKEADEDAIGEPHAQELWHCRWTAGHHGHRSHRALLVFFQHRRRLHLLVCAKRKDVESPLEAGSAQGREKFLLIRQLLVVAVVVGK